jgi:hypothetical protein
MWGGAEESNDVMEIDGEHEPVSQPEPEPESDRNVTGDGNPIYDQQLHV